MPVNFYLELKVFPHDFTMIVMGESVIGHGIGGKVIPAEMAQLAESQSLE
jgi:hypothetical protein